MAVIKVPKTPKQAFNSNRRPSALLLAQVKHLEWAALPASQRKTHEFDKHPVKTEGQAAERIAQLTKLVLAAKAARTPDDDVRDTRALPPVVLPPLPSARRARRAAPKRSRKAAARSGASKAKRHRKASGARKGASRRGRGRS